MGAHTEAIQKNEKWLLDTDYFENDADFIVKILFGQDVEIPENIEQLIDYGYVNYKKEKLELTNKGIELAVEILKEKGEE